MWWVFAGFVAGLVASSFMIVYWLYRLKSAMVEKGWKYTSRFWVLVWIAVFLGSTSGMLRTSTVIQGGTIDVMLFYATPILYFIAPAALVTGIILDVMTKAR